MTPTEALAAIDAGARDLKFFPASLLGPDGIRAIRAVLPGDVRIYAVGGVGADDFAAYAAADVYGFGLGSSLFKPGANPALSAPLPRPAWPQSAVRKSSQQLDIRRGRIAPGAPTTRAASVCPAASLGSPSPARNAARYPPLKLSPAAVVSITFSVVGNFGWAAASSCGEIGPRMPRLMAIPSQSRPASGRSLPPRYHRRTAPSRHRPMAGQCR